MPPDNSYARSRSSADATVLSNIREGFAIPPRFRVVGHERIVRRVLRCNVHYRVRTLKQGATMELLPMTSFPTSAPVQPRAEAHVVILDDDADLRALIGDYLEKQGLSVTLAANGQQLRTTLAAGKVDAVVLDLMMPGEDGLSILRDLADRPGAPSVLMLSAMAADIDRIVGLELGRTTTSPPVNPRELLARLRAVLRRRGTSVPADGSAITRFAGWTLDAQYYTVRDAAGAEVELTSGEFKLLHALAVRAGRVISREELLTALYGDEGEAFDRAIDVAVSRLRAKLMRHDGDSLIRTIRGEGYLFAARN
jgi:two-component system OmpR family response regulator